jgi:Flp pilus assembly protein TadG
MLSMKAQRDRLRSGQRGSIIITAAIFMGLLFLMLGLAIDVSRIYVVRAELQNAADAAALTAARELNGGTAGLVKAVNQAMNVIANTQGLRAKTGVAITSVEFAVTLNGTYWPPGATADANAGGIRYVKVTTQTTSTNILFAISALGGSHVESREAVAGTSIGLSGICDFFPAAVALNDADNDATTGYRGFTPPAIGTNLTLNFNQGTGTEAVLVLNDYIILEVRDINGSSVVETAELTAGKRNYCKSLGDNIQMTPSSNQNNGPENAADGMNTRFGVYPQGHYGNALQPGPYPSDTNVATNITSTQYDNGDPTAGNTRRRLVAAIIAPGTYPGYTTNILDWGVFFLRAPVAKAPQGQQCQNTPGCGDILVEYAGPAQLGTAFGEPTCDSNITTSVLYR